MPSSGCSALHGLNPCLKKCVSLGQLTWKKSTKMPNHEHGHFERNLSLQFHDLCSMRSHPNLKIIWRWSYTCFRVFEVLQQSGKIASQCPDFSKFAHFNFLDIWSFQLLFHNGVNQIFWSSVSWDIGKQLAEQLFWKLRNRDFVPICWNFLTVKIKLAKSCFFKKKFKIYISTKRCNKWLLWSFKYEFEYMVRHS